MSQWPSSKARIVFAALLRIGWHIKRDTAGSHRVLSRPGFHFPSITCENCLKKATLELRIRNVFA